MPERINDALLAELIQEFRSQGEMRNNVEKIKDSVETLGSSLNATINRQSDRIDQLEVEQRGLEAKIDKMYKVLIEGTDIHPSIATLLKNHLRDHEHTYTVMNYVTTVRKHPVYSLALFIALSLVVSNPSFQRICWETIDHYTPFSVSKKIEEESPSAKTRPAVGGGQKNPSP